MKVLVFGGTGKSGLAILDTATIAEGLEVSVFTRSPKKIPAHHLIKLNVIVGDVLDKQAVCDAIKGQDVVLSALGKGNNLAPTTLISEGTHNVIEGMRANNVKKLMVVSVSTELPESKSNGPFFLRAVLRDHKRMLAELTKCDDIEWCSIMLPRIYQLPYTGNYQVAINKRPGGRTVVALDMAEFMISCLTNEEKWQKYSGKMVGITSQVPLTTALSSKQGIPIILTACFIGLAAIALNRFFR